MAVGTALRRGPRFLYAGAPRAGSTWLYRALRAHPGVHVPEAKGLNFFDCHYTRGLNWYLAQFATARPGQVLGEFSHDVYAHPDAARRIAHDLPEMRVILSLREPGDLARSIIEWWLTHTRRFGHTPAQMAAHPHFAALLDYRGAVERFLEELPREQLLVVFFDEIRNDPAELLARVYGFLGVESEFRPETLRDRVNPTRQARLPKLTRTAYAIGGLTRRVGGDALVERIKRWSPVEKALYRPSPDAAAVPPALVEAVRARALVDLPQLEGLIGRPVPSEWRQL